MTVEKQFFFVTSSIALSLTICHLISLYKMKYDPAYIGNPYCKKTPTEEFMTSTTRATGIGIFNNVLWRSVIIYSTFFRYKLASIKNHVFPSKFAENSYKAEIIALFCTCVLHRVPGEGQVLTIVDIFHIFCAGVWMLSSVCFSYQMSMKKYDWMVKYSISHFGLILVHVIAWFANAGRCEDYLFSLAGFSQYLVILLNIRYHYLIFTNKSKSN